MTHWWPAPVAATRLRCTVLTGQSLGAVKGTLTPSGRLRRSSIEDTSKKGGQQLGAGRLSSTSTKASVAGIGAHQGQIAVGLHASTMRGRVWCGGESGAVCFTLDALHWVSRLAPCNTTALMKSTSFAKPS